MQVYLTNAKPSVPIILQVYNYGPQKSHVSFAIFDSQGFTSFKESSTWKDPEKVALSVPRVGDAVRPRMGEGVRGDGAGESESTRSLRLSLNKNLITNL